MSDEDLVIGADKKAAEAEAFKSRSGIAVPMDLVPVSLFGVFKESKLVNGEYEEQWIEQKSNMQLPRGTSSDDAGTYAYMRAKQIGALKTIGTGGEVNFYPLDLFKRFTCKLSAVVGVTL